MRDRGPAAAPRHVAGAVALRAADDRPDRAAPLSADAELDRLLRDLDAARAAARDRIEATLRGAMPADPPAIDDATPRPVAVAPGPPDGAAPARTGPPGSRVLRRLQGLARPVAALVLTAAVVLGGWLLVLEPALGSRPVLVGDEAMSPSLRTGDVALAVRPDGPLGAGTIVAVRRDGLVEVTRAIGREEVPVDAGADARAAAGLLVRADGEPLEVVHVVPLDDVLGEVGAAVPRAGLPVVLLRDPTTSPLGTGVVVVVLALTGLGAVELVRKRRRPNE